MTPRNVHDLPPNLTFDSQSRRYRYRWPATGKRSWVGTDRRIAIDRAEKLNGIAAAERTMRVRGSPDPTLAVLIDAFVELELDGQPFAPITMEQHRYALALYRRELGNRKLRHVDRLVIREWIDRRGGTHNAKNRHRLRFIRLYRYAIGRKWANYNEAEAIPEWSRSLQLAANQVTRRRLSLEQFWRIHDVARLHVQVAMQLSLVTLQARAEVCNMRREDVRDGRLHVVRKKTAHRSAAAFLAIAVTDELERIIALGRTAGIVSPFFVHRLPKSRQPNQRTAQPHPTYVRPQALSVDFKVARNRAGVSAEYGPREAPSFHEIRSLGARLMRDAGADEGLIQTLLAHGNPATSRIYLDDRERVPDQRFVPVSAPLVIGR